MNTVHIIKEVTDIKELPLVMFSTDGSRSYTLDAIIGSSTRVEPFLDSVYGLLSIRETMRISHIESISRDLNISNPTESKLGKALLSKLMNRQPCANDHSLLTLQRLISNHLLSDLSGMSILQLDDDNKLNPRFPKRETLKNKINTLAKSKRFVLALYKQV